MTIENFEYDLTGIYNLIELIERENPRIASIDIKKLEEKMNQTYNMFKGDEVQAKKWLDNTLRRFVLSETNRIISQSEILNNIDREKFNSIRNAGIFAIANTIEDNNMEYSMQDFDGYANKNIRNSAYSMLCTDFGNKNSSNPDLISIMHGGDQEKKLRGIEYTQFGEYMDSEEVKKSKEIYLTHLEELIKNGNYSEYDIKSMQSIANWIYNTASGKTRAEIEGTDAADAITPIQENGEIEEEL